MLSLRQITRSIRVQRAIGAVAAEYLRLVWHSSRCTIEPPGAIEYITTQVPIILAFWHGQHFLTPFVKPKHIPAKVLVSRSRDGEMNAVAAERLGVGTIRGSGTHGTDFGKKGGVSGFNTLARTLRNGVSVAMTADVPKVSRVAGLGIVKLAQMSGRPIFPVAINTRRRIVLNNWDRTTINLPFSRSAIVAAGGIHVPRHSDEASLELARRAVEDALNACNSRAIEIVDGTGGEISGG